MGFLVYQVKKCKYSFLVDGQVSTYSNIGEKFLLDECCFAFLLAFLPIYFLVKDRKEENMFN